MAKYEVKMSCGHIYTIELFGKTADRERKIKYLEESGVCPDCKRAEKNAERAINCKEVEMHYSEYKNNYSACETKAGSYNSKTKTIIVFVPIKGAETVDNDIKKAEEMAIKELCEIQSITKDHPRYDEYVRLCKNTLAKTVDETIEQYATLSPGADETKKEKARRVIEIVKKYKKATNEIN